jgi:magnesium-transporting ATPase (P-type)
VLYTAGWTYGTDLSQHDPLYLRATTACLTALIVMQIANVYLCRSASRSLLATGLFGNRLITCGVVLEVAMILLIDYTPWGNALLDTSPVAAAVWLFIVPFAAGLVVLEELRKWLVRGRQAALDGPGVQRINAP